MFTDDELRANLRAGAQQISLRDFPDAVQWRDLVFADESVFGVVRLRLIGGLAPARVHAMPLSKADGQDFRRLTVADPFDELIFRTLVSRHADLIDEKLGSEVHSYRLVKPGPGWAVRDLRYAAGMRRMDAEIEMASYGFSGLGTLDVEKYYPSIQLDPLAHTLLNLGTSSSDIEALTEWLANWQRIWSIQGVPVGPDASGLLGNAYLIPVDRALREAGVSFHRYTDDYRLFVPSKATFASACEIVSGILKPLGLRLNDNKTNLFAAGNEVTSYLTDDQLDLLDRLGREDRRKQLEAARGLFEAETVVDHPNPVRIKYCLKVLRSNNDPTGVLVAQENPSIMKLTPKTWGIYLGNLHDAGKVDADWIAETALGPLCPDMAAVRLHLMMACARGHNTKAYGERFATIAASSDSTYVPVRCASAEAWAKSDGWKLTHAADAALALGDVLQRRALALILRRAPDSPKRRKALEKVGNTAPECRPAALWIESGLRAA